MEKLCPRPESPQCWSFYLLSLDGAEDVKRRALLPSSLTLVSGTLTKQSTKAKRAVRSPLAALMSGQGHPLHGSLDPWETLPHPRGFVVLTSAQSSIVLVSLVIPVQSGQCRDVEGPTVLRRAKTNDVLL